MKKLTIILLAILVSSLTFSQEAKLNELRVSSEGEFLPGELVAKEIIDANGEVCAGLMIQTDLSGLSFTSYNGIAKLNETKGEYLLFLQESERLVKVYKDGFAPLEIVLINQGINLQSGRVWRLKITGDPDKIHINILTNPGNANIYLDNKFQESGKSILSSIGEHVIRIELDGYNSLIDTINVSENKTLFQYSLIKKKLTGIAIKSTPKGALVKWDNVDKGNTDLQFFDFPGVYKIDLIKPGYLNIRETVIVEEGKTNLFEYSLQKNIGVLLIDLSPADAIIKIDDEIYDQQIIELSPGEHFIEISKTDYLTIFDTIYVVIDEQVERSYELIKNISELVLKIKPADATVIINNRSYGTSREITLTPGNHIIEIMKEGFKKVSDNISINLNEKLNKDYILTPLVGTIQFRVTPINAKVQLIKDSQIIQSWEGLKIVGDIQVGTYTLEVTAEGYETVTKQIQVFDGAVTEEFIELKELIKKDSYALLNKIETRGNVINNASFRRDGAAVEIIYDIVDGIDADYKVELFMVSERDRNYEFKLKRTTGDVGEGRFYGRGKTIAWRYDLEFPGGLEGEDYYLLLKGEKISKGGFPWLVVVGLAIGGGVAAVLAGGGGNGDGGSNGNNGGVDDFPDPPDPPSTQIFKIGLRF